MSDTAKKNYERILNSARIKGLVPKDTRGAWAYSGSAEALKAYREKLGNKSAKR